MYDYRRLTPEQKETVLALRKRQGYPLHEPPHFRDLKGWFLISASTYEHKHHFEREEDRAGLVDDLLKELKDAEIPCVGWVVLPNHYHLLVKCQPLRVVGAPLGRTHGRTSRLVNRRAGFEGRQVWYRYSDRQIRSQAHYYASLNYIHINPVKHGYVEKPLNWPCSSVHWYLEHFGIEWLRETWKKHPVGDYGRGWDW